MSVRRAAGEFELHRWFPAIAAVIIALFCIRNLPWHLDNYDQAKQAYTSFEMVSQGHWWFQHTPNQQIATKPPLAGWLAAGCYHATGGSWEFAWRLPSFGSALALLALVYRGAARMFGSRTAGAAAACAFGLNLFTPRLATLVRTDMLLTLFIFLAGLLIAKKVHEQEPWTLREQGWLFVAVLGSMLTKGPILFAFLLPGLVAYWWWCRRRHIRCFAWGGWWPWLVPLVAFAIWAGVGMSLDKAFYEQVVLKEFLGRFTVGEQAVHRNQPVYFYVVHLLHKFAPWSVLLIAFAAVPRVRERIAQNPALMWLTLWALGGLVFMSLVPSKRPDRIFPVIPPLCLLLGGMIAQSRATLWTGWPRTRVLLITLLIAFVMSGSYSIHNVRKGARTKQAALVNFGAQVRKRAALEKLRFGGVRGPEEGMLLYLRQPRFLKDREAVELWSSGAIDALVVEHKELGQWQRQLPSSRLALESEAAEGKSRYALVVRD